jgi:signal-transduction protein with cAMP-binding, CBS, and nucleotidyltransferase domain
MSQTTATKVHQVMLPSPKMVDGLATVQEAIEQMRREGVGSLVIDHRHEGDEYGLITVVDIAEKVIGRNRSPARTNVYEIMSKPVLTLDAEMEIKYAVRLLCRFGLSRALVTEAGNLAGIVTLRDMVLRSMPEDEGQ